MNRTSIPTSVTLLTVAVILSAPTLAQVPVQYPTLNAVKVKEINPTGDAHIIGMVRCNNKVFFTANDGAHGDEPWVSDGTSSGTFMLKDIGDGDMGAQVSGNMAQLNSKVYFRAFSCNTPVCGYQLWVTDGTSSGTLILKSDLDAKFYSCSAVFNSKLYFRGNGELWVTDGTAAGTTMVKDINPAGASDPIYFGVANGKLFFSADNGYNGRELFVSDGTLNGTILAKDVCDGSRGSMPDSKFASGDKLFFSASPSGNVRSLGEIDDWQLFTSTGAAGSTQIIKEANLYVHRGSSRGLTRAVSYSGKLFFQGFDINRFKMLTDGYGNPSPNYYKDVWSSDGTNRGTSPLTSTTNYYKGAGEGLTVFKGKLYFVNNPSLDDGEELWLTDGTSSGTRLADRFAKGSGTAFSVQILTPVTSTSTLTSTSTVATDKLFYSTSFFTDLDNMTSTLWATEGDLKGARTWKVIGPALLKGITLNKDPLPSIPSWATLPNSFLFSANYDGKGQELWKVTW